MDAAYPHSHPVLVSARGDSRHRMAAVWKNAGRVHRLSEKGNPAGMYLPQLFKPVSLSGRTVAAPMDFWIGRDGSFGACARQAFPCRGRDYDIPFRSGYQRSIFPAER